MNISTAGRVILKDGFLSDDGRIYKVTRSKRDGPNEQLTSVDEEGPSCCYLYMDPYVP